ncbi:MAG: PspC domain-containing protein [Lentimicrobium sp.]|nr:PspC domain-containing protein [Lentimicrobium sp.]
MSETRLYRTVQGRVIGGVAGGLAEYFGIDPTIVRLIFVLLVIFGGSGVLIYLILWIILPEKNSYNTYNSFTTKPPSPNSEGSGVGDAYDGFEQGKPFYPENEINPNIAEVQQRKKMEGSLIGGVILIVLGSMFLIEKFIPRIDFGDLWPVLLIAVGLILIFGSIPRGNKNKVADHQEDKNDTQTF